MISGLITALITPFKNQKVDLDSLNKLVQKQLHDGVEGFVINGTTAESPTLTAQEVQDIFHAVKKIAGPNVPLILGTGTNSTLETIAKTKKAGEIGADAALVVVPYYNKPPQRGLFQHFEAVAKVSAIPIILYNVPGRTITSLDVETVVDLSRIKNIIGIKEASGKKDVAQSLRKLCPPNFVLLSGDDGTYVDFLEAGGNGVISVASHILAKEMKAWRNWVLAKENQRAHDDVKRLLPLIDYLFVEANPIPVKKALQIQSVIESAEMRLPLVELTSEQAAKLKQHLNFQITGQLRLNADAKRRTAFMTMLPKLPSPATEANRWYDVRETAGYLRVASQTLHHWRWLKSGPPFSKIGRKVIYKRSELDAWIASQNSGT